MRTILLTLILAAPCYGVPILDQVNDPEAAIVNGSISVTNTTTTWQQGITAGLDGQLMQIDVYKGNYAPAGNGQFHFNVYLGEAWQRFDPVFESIQTHPGDDWLQTMAIDVSSAGIMLEVGDQYAIELYPSSQNNGVTLRHSRDEYQAGILWRHSTAIIGGPQDTGGADFGFRTWMEPDTEPVPEPSSLVLLALGLLAQIKIREFRSIRY